MLDACNVAVYIVNRDRLSCTKNLVEWLLAAGTKRIVLVDNLSTYPPLLEWYKELPADVVFHTMNENAGPWRSWEWASSQETQPFVFTDSDVVPAVGCPTDLIHKCLLTFMEAGESDGCGKVGPSLRLDNIPPSNLTKYYFDGRSLGDWEGQFWTRRRSGATCASFNAPIDTTFALYGPRSAWNNDWRNIRLDVPYIVEHVPWYAVLPFSDEENYYRAHANYPGTGHHI